jgi:hypothetical protein
MTVSWGSGMYALASYLTLPFVGIFGLSIVATQLPFVLVGVATIPLFYLKRTGHLASQGTYNK